MNTFVDKINSLNCFCFSKTSYKGGLPLQDSALSIKIRDYSKKGLESLNSFAIAPDSVAENDQFFACECLSDCNQNMWSASYITIKGTEEGEQQVISDSERASAQIAREPLRLLLDTFMFKSISQNIAKIDVSTINQHRQQNKLIYDESLGVDKKIIIKPSGNVYCCSIIKSGNFKTAEKAVLLGNIFDTNVLQKAEPKYRAIAFPHKKDSAIKREIGLNIYIRQKKKEDLELSHVNVMKSVLEINSKVPVMFMELYDGDVNGLIRSKKLDMKQKYAICSEMSQGIGQLHEIGLVHRDCKLDNFLYKLNEQHEIERIVVTDLGLSGHIHDDDDDKNACLFVVIAESNFPSKSFAPSSDIFQLGIAFLIIMLGLTIEEWTEIAWKGAHKLSKENTLELNRMKSLEKWKQDPEKWTDLKGIAMFDQIQDTEVKEFLLKMVSENRKKRPLHQEVTAFFQKKCRELI